MSEPEQYPHDPEQFSDPGFGGNDGTYDPALKATLDGITDPLALANSIPWELSPRVQDETQRIFDEENGTVEEPEGIPPTP